MADFEKLKQNVIDMLEEQQQKLGYQKETIRLYYPLESLNHLLGTEVEKDGMKPLLLEFREYVKDQLGELRFSEKAGRYGIMIPPEGAEYVHREVPQNLFLKGLLQKVSVHGCTLDQVREYFYASAARVEERRMTEEFDLLLYFPDGEPDSYYYCLKQEGEHVLYHRFTREDYLSFGFEEEQAETERQ